MWLHKFSVKPAQHHESLATVRGSYNRNGYFCGEEILRVEGQVLDADRKERR